MLFWRDTSGNVTWIFTFAQCICSIEHTSREATEFEQWCPEIRFQELIFQWVDWSSAFTQQQPSTPTPAVGQALRKKSHRVQMHGSVREARDVLRAAAGMVANCCWEGHPRRGIFLGEASSWKLEFSYREQGRGGAPQWALKNKWERPERLGEKKKNFLAKGPVRTGSEP